jgi:hypothetical protein
VLGAIGLLQHCLASRSELRVSVALKVVYLSFFFFQGTSMNWRLWEPEMWTVLTKIVMLAPGTRTSAGVRKPICISRLGAAILLLS